MALFKKLEKIFFPCQNKIDCMMEENREAWDQLKAVVKEKKEVVTTAYPQFANVAGRRHVNPR